jgi:hypothetical protein
MIVTVAVEGCEYTGTSELIVGAELQSEELGEFAAKAVKELMALMPPVNKMEVH